MYQRNNALRMSINITNPLAALRVLEDIAGLRAEEAAPDYTHLKPHRWEVGPPPILR